MVLKQLAGGLGLSRKIENFLLDIAKNIGALPALALSGIFGLIKWCDKISDALGEIAEHRLKNKVVARASAEDWRLILKCYIWFKVALAVAATGYSIAYLLCKNKGKREGWPYAWEAFEVKRRVLLAPIIAGIAAGALFGLLLRPIAKEDEDVANLIDDVRYVSIIGTIIPMVIDTINEVGGVRSLWAAIKKLRERNDVPYKSVVMRLLRLSLFVEPAEFGLSLFDDVLWVIDEFGEFGTLEAALGPLMTAMTLFGNSVIDVITALVSFFDKDSPEELINKAVEKVEKEAEKVRRKLSNSKERSELKRVQNLEERLKGRITMKRIARYALELTTIILSITATTTDTSVMWIPVCFLEAISEFLDAKEDKKLSLVDILVLMQAVEMTVEEAFLAL